MCKIGQRGMINVKDHIIDMRRKPDDIGIEKDNGLRKDEKKLKANIESNCSKN